MESPPLASAKASLASDASLAVLSRDARSLLDLARSSSVCASSEDTCDDRGVAENGTEGGTRSGLQRRACVRQRNNKLYKIPNQRVEHRHGPKKIEVT